MRSVPGIRTAVGKVGKNRGPQYPGTRSTPTVDGDRIYALGSDGDLACLERDGGKIAWSKNLAKEFGGAPGAWAYSESVLIDGDSLVCTPGGKTATRHPGGLAIDAAKFVRRDGTKLVVERDFHGRIGAKTCGPGTGPQPATPDALELRKIVCDAAQAKLFNVALTPDFNRPHYNHFHLEVTANTRWFYLH